jgi:pimeloyl-ACP methyl ester carboxylesterase
MEVAAPTVQLRALTWGPESGPIALCLHGFPDTAYGFRKLAPHLVSAGYRVIAPFMRGYVPSSLPSDRAYNLGALMDDALRVRAAANPTDDDVVIGHDWGAVAATGLAAMPDSPFRKAVVMSVPPAAILRHRTPGLLRLVPGQLLRSWYISYFQLPFAPERSASWIVPLLWRRWSPGYDAREDLRHVDAAIGAPDRWRAALGPYRATIRNYRPPARYAELHRWWTAAPHLPMLYLHGADDGCMTADFTPAVRSALPPGSAAAVVENAGHFLHLERPDEVGRRVVAFLRA